MSSCKDIECFQRDFLLWACEESVSLPELVSSILDSALAHAGPHTAGALVVTEGKREHASVLAVATHKLTEKVAVGTLLRRLRRNAGNETTCRSVLIDSGSDFLGLRPSENGSLALLVEVAAQGDLHLLLLLESSRRSRFGERLRGRLEKVAEAAVAAIGRVVLRQRLRAQDLDFDLVGTSPAFLQLEREVRRAAACPQATVLITGERGSGKEVAAASIHGWSSGWQSPFVPVLASALVENLASDELYGHQQHAFTGADRRRPGKFQAAQGGTLFLDEVADMPPSVQATLTRVVERGEIQAVGRDLPQRVNTRVLAATNRDLERLAASGEFRNDLYDRLRVLEIKVPPLRERRQDIPLLANYFLRMHCAKLRRFIRCSRDRVCRCSPTSCAAAPLDCVSPCFYQALKDYPWPGNVRELSHLMLRLLVTVEENVLEVRHLPPEVLNPQAKACEKANEVDQALDTAMRRHIESVLQATGYNQREAARKLNLSESTLRGKMKKLGIASSKQR